MTLKMIAATAALIGTAFLGAPEASAQDRVLGDVFMFGGNFCPRGSVPANGQLMAVSENTALFSLYGTIYGGDGRTTFAVPDLQGRFPVSAGKGPGLSDRRLGSRQGAETHTLNVNEMPGHTHALRGTSSAVETGSPAGGLLATFGGAVDVYSQAGSADESFKGESIGSTGGNQAFSIANPSLAIQFCVVTYGIYPSRS